MPKRYSLGAPMGYTMEEIDGDDEEAVLNLCLSLSDDEDYQRDVRESTHNERVAELIGMGFEAIAE